MSTKVVTGEVRLSYVNLFEPYAMNDDDEPKYSCTILIPKTDKKTLKAIKEAQQAAAEQGKDKKFKGKVPKNLHYTLRDADSDEEEETLEKNPEYAGHYFMNVSSRQKPGLVDRRVNPILDQAEIYSGVYARVSINAYAYSYMGKNGVSFGLQHVQKTRDGDFLGGRTRAEDDFSEWESDEDEDGIL